MISSLFKTPVPNNFEVHEPLPEEGPGCMKITNFAREPHAGRIDSLEAERASTSQTQGRSRRRGKWQQPGVPHKGWHRDEVTDLGDERMVCEMCQSVEIRYVHSMSHLEYRGGLSVGFVCAQNMSKEYQTPKAIESRPELHASAEIA
jgi:hypothetical protein